VFNEAILVLKADGTKLTGTDEPAERPLEVLVIDSVERPTRN